MMKYKHRNCIDATQVISTLPTIKHSFEHELDQEYILLIRLTYFIL